MKKKVVCLILLVTMVFTTFGCGNGKTGGTDSVSKSEMPGEAIVIQKSELGNPIAGFNKEGELIYGGDPAVLVDGDTVYLYTGHDVATGESYVIPEYQCYSTKDLVNWTYEGVVMSMKDVSWGEKNSAWAGQVAKHYDEALGKDMYYLYFCSWDSTDNGKQSIGVAVSESPTGPFKDIGEALVKGSFTTNETSGWNDIDPTVWIETDSEGVEHRYLCWGNGRLYLCELNEDMISIKDRNCDGKITFGNDVRDESAPKNFTEAPWIYRRQDEDGNYYGLYYLFYAYGWREQLAYATERALIGDSWTFEDVIMKPSATSNTNHPAVFDFQGKTYMIYHNGSLSGGSGFRRVACIEEIVFNEDSSISYIQETATGISGVISTLTTAKGDILGHRKFTNATMDSAYPYDNVVLGSDVTQSNLEDGYWEIVPGAVDESNEYYVSIESYNKAGLYVTATEEQTVVLSQDYDGKQAEAQTFKTVQGLAGEGVSFESVKYEGMYLTLVEGAASLTDGSNKEACTFTIEQVE